MSEQSQSPLDAGYETASTMADSNDGLITSSSNSMMSTDEMIDASRASSDGSEGSNPILFQNSAVGFQYISTSGSSELSLNGDRTPAEVEDEGESSVDSGVDDDESYSPQDSEEMTEEDFVMYDIENISDVPDAFGLRNRLRYVYQANELSSSSGATVERFDGTETYRANRALAYRSKLLHLPDEVIEIILRYLSSNPRSNMPLWESTPRIQDAVNFGLTCRRIFELFRVRIISLRTTPERYREDLLYEPPVAGVVVDARAPTDIENLCMMLRIAGNALRELLITKSLPRNTWVDAFIANVTNLRKLSLRDVNAEYPLESILERCSRSLKELEIVGATGMALSESQLHAMATHCSSITSLALRLSMFDHDWTPVWMGVGPGLQRLSLGATRFWIMDTEETQLLQQIGMYCVDIRRLHFYHLGPTLGNACARLCARYGEQLEWLELEQSQILRPDIQHLVAACPTTKFSVSHGSSLFSHSYNVDVIDFLGPRIQALRYRSQLAHDESLLQVGERCKNLRDLRLDCASTLTEGALESILKGTAATLTNVSMSFFVRGLERALVSSALGLLEKYAGKLQDIQIGGQKFEMEPFAKLMKKCRQTIRKVKVTFGFRTAGEREIVDVGTLASVVRCVHVAEKIQCLEIIDRTSSEQYHNNDLLREVCFPLRKRMERVTICGFDYIR